MERGPMEGITAAIGHRTGSSEGAGPLAYRGASRFVPVAPLTDLPPGSMRTIEADGWRIVVVNVDGDLRAFDNQCPHQGGPLDKGRLDDSLLVCPWHGWKFDARTGRSVWPQGVWQATRFPVSVRDGTVMVQVA